MKGTPPSFPFKQHTNLIFVSYSALASLEDRDNMATSPPSNPTSPMLTKSQPATAERRPSKTPSKDGEDAA
jgi:translation initiation factor 4G